MMCSLIHSTRPKMDSCLLPWGEKARMRGHNRHPHLLSSRRKLCRNALLSALSSRTNVRDLRFLPAVEMTETSTEMCCRIATQSPEGAEKNSEGEIFGGTVRELCW